MGHVWDIIKNVPCVYKSMDGHGWDISESVPCLGGGAGMSQAVSPVWDIPKSVPLRGGWDSIKSVTGGTIWMGIGLFHISHPPYRVIIENYYKRHTIPSVSVLFTG